jgi:uncharacterized iron-regulated protein
MEDPGFATQVVKMHREIFRRNSHIINESVGGYTEAFEKYEREYQKGVKNFESITKFKRFKKILPNADITYVGDYHTLAQAQRGFLRLLRSLDDTKETIIALEFVQGRYQKALDEYMAGRLDDESFLAAIEHKKHWVFGGWNQFRDILSLAKERSFRVIGIDSMGRGLAGSSLHARDLYAARRINKARKESPEARVLVLIGELHVAPKHLPLQVEKLRPKGLKPANQLIVYQNCEQIYWKLEAKNAQHHTEIVKISDNQYCLMNTPPMVCQQSFLNWIDAHEESLELEAPAENLRRYARLIAEFFEFELGCALDELEIATVVDLSFLRRLQGRGDFSTSDMSKIRKQILSSESYYIPKARMVYLGNLSVNHAAEEATHFLRHLCSDSHEPRLLMDAFYWRAMEEAVGFLGSKLINHKRKCQRPEGFEKIYRSRKSSQHEKEVARLFLKHNRMLEGCRVKKLTEVYECDADEFNGVTHAIGYQLGEKIYYALLSGSLDKKEIRELFFDPISQEGDAFTTYLYYHTRTTDVILPSRL